MCGCEAHHTKGKPCTCICPPRDHADAIDVLKQRSDVLSGREPVPGGGALLPGGRVPPPEPEPEPRWLERFGFSPADDGETLQRYLWSDQTNLPDGYLVNEVVVSFTGWSWGLGLEAEHLDLSGYRKDEWWRGATLRVGPFSLTASRHRSEET